MSESGGYILNDLEQVRLLAHPLRSRILMVFCGGEFTTKQVAENLGERPTKLYHHVEMLERAGLIRKTRNQQNRGTVEQYYEAIAKSFQVDPQLFSGEAAGGDVPGVLLEMFAGTGREMAELFPSVAAVDAEDEAVLGHLAVNAEQEHIDELRRRIDAVFDYIKWLGEHAEGEGEEPNRCFRLALAFYPLDKSSSEQGQ
ncbi:MULTISPECIES: helix-turn-helix domain-containing protein [Microbulbifer]|uniref:winged helix-turn-helix domain-containing protein n=1 Tax=Microbulbifer TaxID=48073 RepID=UPI001E471CB7|nr:helix-turn-helix domain-containing protein [Microbulbifer sp. YPW16]UHQ55104.1 helix-turn-helix domain-containing protein [Microbulbifer sp. YPW16]